MSDLPPFLFDENGLRRFKPGAKWRKIEATHRLSGELLAVQWLPVEDEVCHCVEHPCLCCCDPGMAEVADVLTYFHWPMSEAYYEAPLREPKMRDGPPTAHPEAA